MYSVKMPKILFWAVPDTACRALRLPQEYDRPNSAYMLFYERLGGTPPLAEDAPAQQPPAAAETDAPRPETPSEAADTDMAVSPAVGVQQAAGTTGGAGASPADAAGGSPQPMAADVSPPAAGGSAAGGPVQAAAAVMAPVPAADAGGGQRPYNMPASVFQSVMKDNLQVLQEKHTLTKPYFRWEPRCLGTAILGDCDICLVNMSSARSRSQHRPNKLAGCVCWRCSVWLLQGGKIRCCSGATAVAPTHTSQTRRFMRQLVEARSRAGSSKMRRTTGTASPTVGMSAAAVASAAAAERQPAPSRRGEDFDAAAIEAMDTATSFLFSVSLCWRCKSVLHICFGGVVIWKFSVVEFCRN